jgi:hypothetical protein
MLRAIFACGLVALLLLGLGGCGDDATNGNKDVFNRIELEPTQLPTLKTGLIYEGWMVNAAKDSTWLGYRSFGKFFWDEHDFRFLSPNDTSNDIGQVFEFSGNAYDYNMIAITLEPFPVDADTAPSPSIIALSSIDPDQSTFMRFPLVFGSSQSSFTIGTFSDGHYKEEGQPLSNERYGIWFISLTYQGGSNDTNEFYAKGLDLPVLPDTGFLYEGWVALTGGDTLSTGKFFSPSYVDYDNSHCVDGAIPNFPGEDFLQQLPTTNFPPDMLRGGTALVTLEPNPDNEVTRPSPFVVLTGNMPVDSSKVRKSSYPLGGITPYTFPRISVTFTHAD